MTMTNQPDLIVPLGCDEIANLPSTIRRFIRRAVDQSDLVPTDICFTDHHDTGICTVTMRPTCDDNDVGSVAVYFRRRPAQGWRFVSATTGWEITYRTIADLLYHN